MNGFACTNKTIFCLITPEHLHLLLTISDYDTCITVKNLAIQLAFSWFPVVIIRVVNYQRSIFGHAFGDIFAVRC
jgi:hypothetical protein